MKRHIEFLTDITEAVLYVLASAAVIFAACVLL